MNSSPPITVTQAPAAEAPRRPTHPHRALPHRRPEHVPKPHIIWDPIPFGPERKEQMVAYVRRHYGSFMKPTWRLRNPHVIVIHYTETPSFQATYNTFAPDTPDPELHELPNTCAHFVIDRAGGIHQLVPLETMCRHTVGLNWTAIGIEHVGYSDWEVLDDPAPDGRQPAPGPLAALPLPHPDPRRDRPQREPLQPLPPRGRALAAHPDALRLRPRRHEVYRRRLAEAGACPSTNATRG